MNAGGGAEVARAGAGGEPAAAERPLGSPARSAAPQGVPQSAPAPAASAAASAPAAPGNPGAGAEEAKATLKVHLPNDGVNVVKYGDAIDVKVSAENGLESP